MTAAFYDELAPCHHLLYGDWQAAVAEQGAEVAVDDLRALAGSAPGSMAMYLASEPPEGDSETRVLRSRYYAVSIERLLALLAQAGFDNIERRDDVLFQPVLIGRRTIAAWCPPGPYRGHTRRAQPGGCPVT